MNNLKLIELECNSEYDLYDGGERLGGVEIEIMQEDVLYIHYLSIKNDYQGSSYSLALLKLLLQEFPSIVEIQGESDIFTYEYWERLGVEYGEQCHTVGYGDEGDYGFTWQFNILCKKLLNVMESRL